MSVITNKDRINENNDRINRLIALVKQKALTSNPKFATTEDEMDAMITDKHVGKVVKYLGEAELVGTPPAVGDTIDKLYFNTSVTPDLSVFDYGESGLINLVAGSSDFTMQLGDMSIASSGQMTGHYMFSPIDNTIIFSDFEATNMGISMGWNTTIAENNGVWSFGYESTIDEVNQQDLWSSFISKEPFAAGGKYEKNALYIIAEGESEVIENPTAVGDEVTQIYFDTTKSNEEIVADLEKLEYTAMSEGVGVAFLIAEHTADGSPTTGKYLGVTKYGEAALGEGKCMYGISNGANEPEHLIFAYGVNVTPADMGFEFTEWGWQTTSPVPSLETYTIAQVNGKEIWGGWLSAHENGFASVGAPAAPRARRLNITEGSLAINKNGKFDVSNMESVEVNIVGGGLLTASTEDEMDALLVEDNLGQVVKYVGEAGELIGVPPAVGDTIETLYFNTSVTPDFEAIKASSTIIKGADIHGDWANAYFTHYVTGEVPAGTAENYFGFFDMSEMQEGLFIIADDQMTNMVYISQDVSADITGGEAIKGGWQMDSVEASALWPRNDSTPTWVVQQIGGQDLWGAYISKTPFAAGGKYETDGLYAIAEGAPGTPVAVGDTISALYFDVSKEPDFSAFDFNEDNYNNVSIDFDGGSYYTLSLNKLAGDNSPTGQDEYVMFLGEGELIVYCSFEFENEGVVYYTKGWQQPIIDANGRVDFPEAGVVEAVEQQAGGWDTFVSKEPFATGDLIKFEHHIVPNGVMPINDNGIFDVTNKSTVVVDIQPNVTDIRVTENGIYDATDNGYDGYRRISVDTPIGKAINVSTEEEMNAVLTSSSNFDKIYYYTGPDGTYDTRTYYLIKFASDGSSMKAIPIHGISVPTLEITENGTYNVATNESVKVNVSLVDNSTTIIGLSGLQATNGSGLYYDTANSAVTTNIHVSGVSEVMAEASTPSDSTCIGNTSQRTDLISIYSKAITRIGSGSFRSCTNLKSVYLPNITQIPSGVFDGCTSLTSLTIPSGVTIIGVDALKCGSSTNKCTFIFERTTPPSAATSDGTTAVFNLEYINKIIVPAGCGDAYKASASFSSVADYIEEATA